MTVLVGIYCTDGVVVAADSASTFTGASGATIIHPVRKIEIIGGQMIVAGTGAVGLGQRFSATLQGLYERGELKGSEIDWARKMCQEGIADFEQTRAPKGFFGALVAFLQKNTARLCEFAISDFQPEMKGDKCWYVSMGYGQALADPYLALMRMAFWADGPPTLDEGVFAAAWVMHHAIEACPGAVREPIDIAVLSAKDKKAKLLEKDELDEHKERVAASIAHLREFNKRLDAQEGASPIPEP